MKLKKLSQIMLAGCLISLVACSSMHKKNAADAAGGTTTNEENVAMGAQTAGLGQGDNYNEQGGAGAGGSQRSAGKRTYYFDFDRSDVHEDDKPAIYSNADHLVANNNAKATVEGHTDPRGSREYNVALGERRADAVLDILKTRGVNPKQVRVVSYGAERPAASGRSEEDYQQDRRAVLDLAQR